MISTDQILNVLKKKYVTKKSKLVNFGTVQFLCGEKIWGNSGMTCNATYPNIEGKEFWMKSDQWLSI